MNLTRHDSRSGSLRSFWSTSVLCGITVAGALIVPPAGEAAQTSRPAASSQTASPSTTTPTPGSTLGSPTGSPTGSGGADKAASTTAGFNPSPGTEVSTVTPTPATDLERVLTHLRSVGLPVGNVSDKLDGDSRRALCIARAFLGTKEGRGGLRSDWETNRLLTFRKPLPTPEGVTEGLNVSITCQAAYFVAAGEVQRVMRVTTGRGESTPRGEFRVQRKTNGWRYSTIYKDARLYKPMNFNGAIAAHGVAHPSWIKTEPASHGCVRIPNRDMDWLYPNMPVKSKVRVYGAW